MHPLTTHALRDKRVWITGASSGIGKSLAQALAKQGCRLVISARNAGTLNTLAEQLSTHTAAGLDLPCQVTALPMDVSSDLDVSSIQSTLQESLADNSSDSGSLDICIICAGHCEYLDDVENIDLAMFQRVFETNFFGALRTVQVALPVMQSASAQGYAQGEDTARKPLFVFISSLASVVPFPRAEAYGASKAALGYFAESLRLDLLDKGVDVLLVDPGFVKTPMTDKNDFDMPFLMETEEAASRIVRAIEKRAMYCSFPRRLAWPLRFFSSVPWLWNRFAGPNLRKPVH